MKSKGRVRHTQLWIIEIMISVTFQEEEQHDSHPVSRKVDKNQIAAQLIIAILYVEKRYCFLLISLMICVLGGREATNIHRWNVRLTQNVGIKCKMFPR